MVINMESGPNGNGFPVGLPPEVWGLAPGFGQTPLAQAISTGKAGMGIAVSALEALSLVQMGRTVPLVAIDLTQRMPTNRDLYGR